MNISIDLHGVLDEDPEYWTTIAKHIGKDGGNVYLLTGSTVIDAIEEVEKLGFDISLFAGILSTTEFLLEQEHEWITDIHGRPSFHSHVWWEAKGYIANKYNIDIHYDNDKRYHTYFWPKNIGFGLYTKELITLTLEELNYG